MQIKRKKEYLRHEMVNGYIVGLASSRDSGAGAIVLGLAAMAGWGFFAFTLFFY